jgi:hypothetical protein
MSKQSKKTKLLLFKKKIKKMYTVREREREQGQLNPAQMSIC